MRVKGLDGREYTWNVSAYERDPDRSCSSHHDAARSLLQKLFPLDRILEEVTLPGTKGLVADFYLSSRKIIVEVHGPQHYEFTPFFHKTVLDFLAQKKRDKQKKEWCLLNGIGYIEFPFTEEAAQWASRLAI